MAETYDDDEIVTIIPGRIDHPDAFYALKSPTFILRYNDILYSTLGALEYDPKDATTDDQRRDVAQLESDFEDWLKDGERCVPEVVCDAENKVVLYQATNVDLE